MRRHALPSRHLTALVGNHRAGAAPMVSAFLAGALVAVATTVASPAMATTPAASVECSQPPTAVDASAAVQSATGCGHDVEVLGARTEHNTLYAQPDGTMRLDVSALAIRTRQDDTWVDVDNTVVLGSDGFEVAAAVTPMTFSDGSGDAPLATIERDGHVLTFDVPFDLPRPEVSGARLTYRGVLPGVDLIVTVEEDATGFSEVLRVATPEAAADPRLSELAFPVEVSDGLDLKADEGGFVATDENGETLFSSPVPAMWDSREPLAAPTLSSLRSLARTGQSLVTPSPDVPQTTAAERGAQRATAPVGGETVRMMPARIGRDTVEITPDRSLIEDPATVWPVYIDPSVSGSRVEWTAVRDAYPQSYKFDPDQGLGLCNRATSTTCPKTFKSRLLWKFSGLEAIGGLAPDNVLSTTFSAVGTHSWDCTARPVTLYRVDNWSASTPWPGGPTWVPQSTQTVAHKSSCAGQPVRWIEFPALEAGRAVAQFDSTQLTLGLAVDESSMANWKRYRNDAGLSITFNRVPNLPVDVRFVDPGASCVMGSGRPVIRTATPTLYGVHSDPDGDNVQANVDVYLSTSPSGSGILWHGRPPAQGSGAGQRVAVGGMAHGHVYRVQMNSVDTSVWGGPGVSCEVEVDLQAPAAPSVAAVASGSQPIYGPSIPTGGVGKTGSFRFGNGGSTDVVRYRYSFNGTALDHTAEGSAATITFSPSTPGPQTLSFQSIDRAGWTSEMQTYHFSVAVPGKVTWDLDTPGTTAAGVHSNGLNVLPLIVSQSARVPGRLTDLGFGTSDQALGFTSSANTATTSGPAVLTTGSFSVSAVVKTTVASGTATAVSQGGKATAAFDLGYRTCADGVGSCWAFSMNPADTTTAAATSVVSTTRVKPNEWVEVTGVHDAVGDKLTLWVCTVSAAVDEFGDSRPVGTLTSAGTKAFAAPWVSGGPLQLGRSITPGSGLWTGAISGVRVADGALTEAQLRTTCDAPAS